DSFSLFKKWHSLCGILPHTFKIDIDANTWFLRKGYESIFNFGIVVNHDLVKHRIGVKIDLPFDYHKIGYRSTDMAGSHRSQKRSHHVRSKRHVIEVGQVGDTLTFSQTTRFL